MGHPLAKLLRPLALVALGGLVATCAFGQVTKTGKGYLFRLKYKAGAVYNYELASTATLGKTTQKLAKSFTMRILEVSKASAKVRYVIGPWKIGKQTSGKTETFEVRQDSLGRVVGGPTVQPLGQVSLPERPVKIGDKWGSKMDATIGNQSMPTRGELQLLGFKAFGSRRAAVLGITVTTAQAYTTKGKGTILVDMADGAMLTSTVEMTITPGAGAGGTGQPIRVRVTISRAGLR